MVLLIDPQALLSGRELSELGIEGVSADAVTHEASDGAEQAAPAASTGGGLRKSKSSRKESADAPAAAVHD